MGFPTRLLLEDEKIVLDLRQHWWYFAGPAAAGVPVLAVVGFLGTRDQDALKYLGLALFAVWALWLGARLASWATTHFVITTERLIFRSGLLSKHGRDVPLDRINDIASNQSLLERLLRSGDLLIESAGERGQQTFSNIRRPDAVQQEIHRQVEAHEERERFGGAAPKAAQSVPEQIAALAALRDSGVLSEQEFQAKKADLLSRM